MNSELLEAEIYDDDTKRLKLKAFTAVISDDHVTPSGYGKDEHIQWTSTDSVIHWDVKFVNTGQLEIAMNLGNNEDNVGSEVEIEVDGEKMVAVPPFTGGVDQPNTVKLGSISVTKTGCFSVKMKAKSINGDYVGKFWYLELSGDAAVGSVEDMLPRCADDVCLNWIVPSECDILYCAVTPLQSHMGTEFTPINSGFSYHSLLDYDYEGNRCISSSSCDKECIYKTSILQADETGLIFPWNMKETYHFLVKVVPSPEKDALLYFRYVYFNDESKWKLIMALKGPNVDSPLKEFISVLRSQYGLQMGYFPREAAFGPVWGRLHNGEWKEILACEYAKWGIHLNTDAFVSDNRIHLCTGGRPKQSNKIGTVFNLEPSEHLPEILQDIDSKLEGIPPE